MADANDKAVAPVTQRILTISSQRRPRPMKTYAPAHIEFFPDLPPAPWIRLSGRWLKEAGFEISGKTGVEVQKGRLVITPQ
ncbi:SymE family type I addiction module toxin [Paraburkholderia sp. BL17N1]|uniref:SymE family type I addiction module toxin n=1 Tax=Paraburkholderia sp. BL17N1 TaxID=1938798 RepID=UPI000EB31D21|nr:SymE family type I addiction module toxin [Paraburkholderia sp. BL17N1]RKR43609.1 type I toxin-antitoxin system toxin SymE [Paraburkholderia sp. BL17N1]